MPVERVAADKRRVLALVEALSSGRVPAREAILSARALIEAVRRAAQVTAAVFLLRAELARVTGLPLEAVLP